MSYVSLGNPIWSCQFQLLGGTRRIIPVAVVYTSLLVGVYFMFQQLLSDEFPLRQISKGAIGVGAVIQCGLLVIVGAGAIHKALMREFTTGMIDSYRTSRIGAVTAVIGYMFGGTLQVILLWLIGVGVGALICTAGQAGGVREWLNGNVCLIPSALCMWSLQVFFGVGHKKPANVAVLAVVISFVLSGVIREIPYLGGSYFLIGGASGIQAYAMMNGAGALSDAAPAIGAALLMTVFWLAAAARRFRRPYLPALDPLAAVGLLLAWCAAGVIGAVMLDGNPVIGTPDADQRKLGMVVLPVIALLIAMLPAMMATPLRRRVICGWRPRYRHERWPAIFVIVMAIIITDLFAEALSGGWGIGPAIAIPFRTGAPWPFTTPISFYVAPAVVFVSSLVMWSVYRRNQVGAIPIMVLILWFGVPLLDLARLSMTGANVQPPQFSILLSSSPAGSILNEVYRLKAPITAGLAVQVGLAILALWMARSARARFIASRDATRCRDCGYSLVGNTSGVCPECGTRTQHDERVGAPNQSARPAPPSTNPSTQD